MIAAVPALLEVTERFGADTTAAVLVTFFAAFVIFWIRHRERDVRLEDNYEFLNANNHPLAIIVIIWCAVAIVMQIILAKITKWSRFKTYAVSLTITGLLAGLAEWYFIDDYTAIGLLASQAVIAGYNAHKLKHME